MKLAIYPVKTHGKLKCGSVLPIKATVSKRAPWTISKLHSAVRNLDRRVAITSGNMIKLLTTPAAIIASSAPNSMIGATSCFRP